MLSKARRQYTRRKEVKEVTPAFTLTVLSVALSAALYATGAAANEYTYAGDPGFVARSPGEVAAAKASWETEEYGTFTGHNPLRPFTPTPTNPEPINSAWQLFAINASTAYALGYFGQDVTLGMMDSGYRATHEGFQTDLIKSVQGEGVYATSGFGYRGANPTNEFVKGDTFNVAASSADNPLVITNPDAGGGNNIYSHGTGMLGVTSATRDGNNMHGIAFGSEMYNAWTGGSDSQSHGPFHDYVYWYTANKAFVDAGAQVINSSWGSYVQTTNRSTTDAFGNTVEAGNGGMYEMTGRDNGNMQVVLPNQYLKDLEFQYFLSKKTYSEGGIQYNPNYPGLSFMDAIWDAIKGTSVVNVRSAGNNDWDNPFYRPSYPLFNPWAENQWVAVGGVTAPSAANGYEYQKTTTFNEGGLAKWWTVSTPSNNVMTTNSGGDTNFSNSSGTSPATPVATGVMGVLLSRYQNMDAMQVRELMFTTANNKMTDGVRFLGAGTSYAWTAPDGLPDDRWGWGIPDLDKGMYGPGQFLSPMVYNMDKAPLDVWSNDISQIAIKEREKIDQEWLAGYKAQGIAYAGEYSPNVYLADGTLSSEAFMVQGLLNDPYIQAITNGHPELYDKISLADAQKWRKEWMDDNAAYIQHKIDNGLYTASLTKQGPGRLVLTGNNTYEGGTIVEAGELYGFTESFGAGKVAVNGGKFGVLSSYNDTFTMKGDLTSTQARKVSVDVNAGGTFAIMLGNDASVNALTFSEGSFLTLGFVSDELLQSIWQNDAAATRAVADNPTATGSVTANSLIGFEKATVLEYAFMDQSLTWNGNALAATLRKNNDLTYASYGSNRNARNIGAVIDANHYGDLYDALPYAPGTLKSAISNTLNALGNDLYLNADTASVVNSLSIVRTVKNQAQGLGTGRTAKLNDTARIWATVAGNWSDVDFGRNSDVDVDFQAALVGAEVDVSANNTVGLYFGAGSTDFKGGRYGKVDSDDIHFGLYGIYKAPVVSFAYGVQHTRQDRDARRTLVLGNDYASNKVSTNAKITQFFAEAAYTGLNSATYSVEPYVGLGVIKVKADGFNESVNGVSFRTKSNSQTFEAGTIGLRGSIPLSTGNVSVALKGDIYGTHFFGNTKPEARLYLGNTGSVKLRGGELDNLLGVGLGLEASVSKSTKIGLSYNGAFNSDVKSHGVFADIRISF
jgi:subtilase-type serine protease